MAGLATATPSTTESLRTNYARIGHAAQQTLPEILQKLLAVKEPQFKLHSDVSSNQYLRSNLKAGEWSMINNAKVNGYVNFDIQLCYRLIRNLNIVQPPTQGWDKGYPAALEISPGDDIERIRQTRNKILHRGNTKVSDMELEFFFVAFTEIAERLEQYLGKPKDDFVKPIDELRTCSMDEATEQMYLERLERLRKKEEDLAKAVLNIHEDVNSLINRDSNKFLLERWQEQNTLFVKTDVVDNICETLEEMHVVSVTGNSGVGKSATVHHVALCLRDNQGYQIFECFSPSDIFEHYRKGKLQAFVFDDVCGSYTLIQSYVEDWIKMIMYIEELISSGNIKLLATCRSQVFREEQFQRIKLFTKNSFDLSAEKCSLSTDKKLQIAKQYLSDHAVECIRTEIDEYEYLPLMFALYKPESNTPSIADVKTFFRHPFDRYTQELNELKYAEDKKKFCALFLLVTRNGSIDESLFMEESLYDRTTTKPTIEAILEACDINRYTPIQRIKQQLDCLVGLFVKKTAKFGSLSEHVYTAIHDKMFDFLCHYFGNHFQTAFIRYVDAKVLYEHTQLKCKKYNGKEFSICIDEKSEKEYLKRVLKNLLFGEIPGLFNYFLAKNKEFRLKLCQYTQQLNDDVVQKYGTIINANGMCLLSCAINLQDMCLIRVLIEKGVNVNYDITKQSPLTAFPNDTIYRCYKDDSDKLKMMKIHIEKGASVNKIESQGETPLHPFMNFIVKLKYDYDTQVVVREMIGQLLENGANVNTSDRHGITPLTIACKIGDIGLVRLLIEWAADVNPRNDDSIQTPLSVTLSEMTKCSSWQSPYLFKERCEVVQLLIENEADLSKVTQFDNHPLICFLETMYDALFGNWETFKEIGYNTLKLLLDKGIKVNKFSKDGQSSLILFLARMHEFHCRMIPGEFRYKTFQLLLDKGANVNFVDIHGMTPLTMACAIDEICLIKLLLDKGANVNFVNTYWMNPLTSACKRGDICLIKLLLQKGAAVNISNDNFITFGLLAKYCGNENLSKKYETVELLERANIDGIKENSNKRDFYYHFERELRSLVKFLIEKGSGQYSDNDDLDQTPLTAACSLNTDTMFYVHNRIIKMLLDKGANINQLDKSGVSPIEAARKVGNINLLNFLIKYGAEVTLCQGNLNSLFFEAIQKSEDLDDYGLLELLLEKGVNVNTINDSNKTPLTIACENGDISLMKFLIEKKAQIELNNENIITFCLKADHCKSEITHENYEIVELLLDRRVKIREINKNEFCRDVIAATEINSLVKALVKGRFDENHIHKDPDEPLLVEICYTKIEKEHYAQIKVIEMLLNKGVNINQVDKWSISPLAAAFRTYERSRNCDLIMFLMKNGACLKIEDLDYKFGFLWDYIDNQTRELLVQNNVCQRRKTLLMLACEYGLVNVIKFITSRGIVMSCNQGNLITSFLRRISWKKEYEIFEKLLCIQENIDKVDKSGQTPLTLACSDGDLSLVKLLIEKGARVNPDKTELDNTPLMAACNKGKYHENKTYYEIIQILLDRGADINEVDNDGFPPFTIAIEASNLKLITLLIDNGADVPPNYTAFVDNFLRQNNVQCLKDLSWLQMEMFQYLLKKEVEKARHQRFESSIRSIVAKRKNTEDNETEAKKKKTFE